MCLPASGNLYQLTMGIKMRLKLQTFFLLLFLLPAYLFGQVPSLFEIQDQPETEWAAKTASDIRRVAIMMNEDLLQTLRSGETELFTMPDLSGQPVRIEVQRIIEQLDGDWSLTGHIDGNWMDSFFLSVSGGQVLSSFRQTTDHQFLEIRYKPDQQSHFLLDIDPHQREELACGHEEDLTILSPNSGGLNQRKEVPAETDEPVIIDVMIVYTPAAETWANRNGGGIRNVVNQSMAIAQQTVDNSELNLLFRLVHQRRVDYSETGNSTTDLRNLTNGVIPGVHSLRNEYGADLVSMFTSTHDVGGIAWMQISRNPEPYYGYSITRVQQAATSATHIHEMGHNMGSAHSRNQRSNPASESGGVFRYSTGWRWEGNDLRQYTSVMTYPEGGTRIDIFSNPHILYMGEPTGSYGGIYAPADNSRSIRNMKHAISQFRETRVFGSPVSSRNSSLQTSAAVLQANEQDKATLTVTLRDSDGHPLPYYTARVYPSNRGAADVSPSITGTDENGVAEFQVSSRKPGDVDFIAQGEDVQIDETTRIEFIGIDADLSEMHGSTTEVQANGEDIARIEVIARDRYNHPFSNAEVTLQADRGDVQIHAERERTDSEGRTIFNVSSLTTGTVVFRAELLGTVVKDQVVVNFLPVAPVALAASEVEARKMTANWERVENAQFYQLEVSTDEEFASLVPGYESADVGISTSHVITGLSPGTDYFYRVRAKVNHLMSTASHTISTTTYPDVPVVLRASELNAREYRANWQLAEGARTYKLDLSARPDFTDYVSVYENYNVQNITSLKIFNLEPGEEYFYRVRSKAGPRVSANSEVMSVRTLDVSPENSSVTQEQYRILANGVQSNPIDVVVRSAEKVPLKGLTVELIPDREDVEIGRIRGTTGQEGNAHFTVRSHQSGTVAFEVQANRKVIDTVEVEFIADEGELKLGDNYPNPFDGRTTLPVLVPHAMHIELQVYDAVGRFVRTLVSETKEAGYHEIPFEMHGLSTGVYFYRVVAGGKVITKKMVKV